MLRGGETLDIGWAVMVIALILIWAFLIVIAIMVVLAAIFTPVQ